MSLSCKIRKIRLFFIKSDRYFKSVYWINFKNKLELYISYVSLCTNFSKFQQVVSLSSFGKKFWTTRVSKYRNIFPTYPQWSGLEVAIIININLHNDNFLSSAKEGGGVVVNSFCMKRLDFKYFTSLQIASKCLLSTQHFLSGTPHWVCRWHQNHFE